MRKLLILLLLLTINLYGQQENNDIIVKVYIVSPCDSVPKLDLDTFFQRTTPVDSLNFYSADNNGETILPSPGKYSLYGYDLRVLFEIDINEPGVYEYKRYVPRISWVKMVSDAPPEYYNCDKLCEGYVEDFYENGNPKIRGNFKNGYPKDSLVEFYPNGKVKDRTIYKGKSYTSFDYDSLGNLEKKFWAASQSYKNNYFKHTWYYSNGIVKFNASERNRLTKVDCFYPDGTQSVKQRKKYRIEYYENGNIKSIHKWKKRRDYSNYFDFVIITKLFDENGKLLKTEENRESVGYLPQPEIAYTELN